MAGTWVALKNEPSFTAGAMVLLPDGAVLVQAHDASWYRLSPDSSGSYVNGFRLEDDLPDFPDSPVRSSAILADGRVFITTGNDSFNHSVIYDPAKGSAKGSLTDVPVPEGRWASASPVCVLPDGRLIMGSVSDTRTAIYHPVANSWSAGPAKNDASQNETWTLLPDGTVLCVDLQAHPHAEKYVPSANAWVSAGSIPVENDLVLETTDHLLTGPAVLMPDGRVFAIGASGHTALYTPPPDPADPGSWAAGPDFPADDSGRRWGAPRAPAVLLPNGRVLCIVGFFPGFGDGGEPCRAFEFDGTALIQVPDPPDADVSRTSQYRLLLLPTGEVLCATDQRSDKQRKHVYQPDGEPDPAWAPVILSSATIVRAGGTFTLQGQQLNGLSQAHSDSAGAQSATNFPLARIQSDDEVHYGRTHGFSTMGVATGATVASTEVDVPDEVPAGSAQLFLVANGIATPSFSPIEIGPRAAWRADTLDPAPAVTAAAGNPAGYVFRAQATQHVVYRGTDHHIYELWGNSTGWHSNDLIKAAAPHPASATGAAPAAGDPAGYAFDAQATRHVVYRGTDNHIHELWWNNAGWHGNDLTKAAAQDPASPTHAAPAAGDPAGYVFDAGGGHQHVVYRGTDSHIYQLWRDPTGWRMSDLTAATGAAPAAGDPAGYAFNADGGRQHVVYRGTDDHVHQLWRDTAGWHTKDLTAATGAAPATGDPAGYAFNARATQQVIYRSTDNHIHQLWWNTAGWHTKDLTAATGAAPATGDPAGYAFDARATQHIVYRGPDDHIHQLWWDITGWHTSDVSAACGRVSTPSFTVPVPMGVTAPVTAVGDPAGYVFDAHGGSQRVLYRGFDDRIHQLQWG